MQTIHSTPFEQMQSASKVKPPAYNFEELEHLFIDGKIPEELL
jgi:hypothetical protein